MIDTDTQPAATIGATADNARIRDRPFGGRATRSLTMGLTR